MNVVCLILTGVFFSFLMESEVFAAAAVQRRVQMQKQVQEQMYQQAVAQKQAEGMAAYQQAMAQQQGLQQQAYQQAAYQKAAVEYAAQRQAMQQAVAQRSAELQAAEQAKALIAQRQAQEVDVARQAVMYKNASELAQARQAQEAQMVAEARAQLQTNEQIREYTDFMTKRKMVMQAQAQQVEQAQVVGELMQYNEYQKVRVMQARAQVEARLGAQAAARSAGARMAQEVMAVRSKKEAAPLKEVPRVEEAETVVNLQELWHALEESSRVWAQIIDQEIKILTVSEYIDRFQRAGIKIRKSPGYYAAMIDSIAGKDLEYLSASFMNVLSYAAIVDYDFENGENKDVLARRILGEKSFLANRERLQAH